VVRVGARVGARVRARVGAGVRARVRARVRVAEPNPSPHQTYIARVAADTAYAKALGIEMGGYTLMQEPKDLTGSDTCRSPDAQAGPVPTHIADFSTAFHRRYRDNIVTFLRRTLTLAPTPTLTPTPTPTLALALPLTPSSGARVCRCSRQTDPTKVTLTLTP
jgi:hypothetical protein